jgi:signal transduction histidine kinase
MGRQYFVGSAALFTLMTLLVPVGGSGAATSYAAVSPLTRGVFLIAGLGLILAAAVVAADATTGALGPLAAAAGACWLAPAWIGWDNGPPVIRSVAMIAAYFLVPVLLHLAMAAPSGRIAGPVRLVAVLVGYAATTVAAIGLAITRDPFLDPHCWDNCTDNVFVAVPDPAAARWLEIGWHAAVVIGGIGAAIVAGGTLAAATPVARSLGWPLLASAGLANLAEATGAAALLVDPAENPTRAGFLAVFYFRALSLTLVAVGLAALALERRRRRAAVARLADDLAAEPAVGALQTMLARSFGDKSLSVAYWLPDAGRFVDPTGESVDPTPSPGRATTTVVRSGRPVAVITHDRALDDDRALADQIGPAARLAIDNERLMAEVLDQLKSLRAIRGRIVRAADDTRRRIERDLHDGAQQRLLAVTFELRLARAETTDAGQAAVLDAAIARATAALADLRDIAHGIFPAILDESGLGPALWSLTDQTEAQVEISGVPEVRLPAVTERTAYLVVVHVLDAAQPDYEVAIAIRLSDRGLMVGIDGVALTRTVDLDDRVRAAGGTLRVNDRHVQAVLPCG